MVVIQNSGTPNDDKGYPWMVINCRYLGLTPNGPLVVPLFWRTPPMSKYMYVDWNLIDTVRTATSFRSGSVPLPVIWCRLENIIWKYARRGVLTFGKMFTGRCAENPNVSKRPESDVWIFDAAKQAHRCWEISVGSCAEVQQWHCKPIKVVRWSFSVSNCWKFLIFLLETMYMFLSNI